MMNHETTICSYRTLLNNILLGGDCICPTDARKLHDLALTTDEGTKTRQKELLKELSLELQKVLVTVVDRFSERSSVDLRPWEGVAQSLLQYRSRLSFLKEHIDYIDRTFHLEGSLIRRLENKLVQSMLEKDDTLIQCYKKACMHYICKSKDIVASLTVLYQSLCENELSKEQDGNTPDYELLNQLVDMGLTCLKEWRSRNQDADFFEIYKVWENTQDLMRLLGIKSQELSGFTALFNDNPHELLKSLNDILLTSDEVYFLRSLSNTETWIKKLDEAFLKLRNVKFLHGDFDLLLQSILMGEYKSNNNNTFDFVISNRQNFIRSVSNVQQFQASLIQYLELKFQKNYKEIRKNSPTRLSHLDNLWISAVTILIVYYLPQRRTFMNRYLKESLFRQMLMLNSKFPQFIRHACSLQRQLIENLHDCIPIDVQPHLNLINDACASLSHTHKLNNSRTNFVGLYLSHDSFMEVCDESITEETAIWPSSGFQRDWANEVSKYTSVKKVLRGLFSLHFVTMSSPFRSPSGMNLKILAPLTMASVIVLFNDHDELSFNDIYTLLDAKDEAAIKNQLKKLLQHQILVKRGNLCYSVNEHYKPTRTATETGVIRLTSFI